ncbi:MAG: hypothetical protein D6736_21170, partial [Nitrospinota bacterium]
MKKAGDVLTVEVRGKEGLVSEAASLTPTRRRLLADRLARWVIRLGGMLIIFAILAILLVILAETFPLFRPPTATLVGTV